MRRSINNHLFAVLLVAAAGPLWAAGNATVSRILARQPAPASKPQEVTVDLGFVEAETYGQIRAAARPLPAPAPRDALRFVPSRASRSRG